MRQMIGAAVVVTIPGIFDMASSRIELDEADASFQQPSGDQAFLSEVGGAWIVDPVELTSFGGLPLEIDRFGRRRLHPKSQLIGLQPRRQFALPRPTFQMDRIELMEEVQTIALGLIGGSLGRCQVEQRRVAAAEKGSLKIRRHVAAGPIRSASNRTSAWIGHDDETGEVLLEGPQAIAEPRAKGGFADENAS